VNIRNFAIIAHIDHGKSTLADRLLEFTGTISKEKLIPQYLDRLSLERERGITIKMQPVRMLWHPDRGLTQNGRGITQKEMQDTSQNKAEFLYGDLTYKIRGAFFGVRKTLGLGHKEQVYHSALEIEFEKAGLRFESKKNIPILYEGKHVGMYQPDFVIEDKVIIELKALPEIGKPQVEQVWSYLKGCDYRLAFLVNFGSKELGIERIVYDTARDEKNPDSFLRESASVLRNSAGAVNQVEDSILNLIDTPGHTDFGYEVSRALKAVEGVVLLVDAAKGIQAQTVFNFRQALAQHLIVIPAINKIDLKEANIERVAKQLISLFETYKITITSDDILKISAKSGIGTEDILRAVVEKIPPPPNSPQPSGSSPQESAFQALIFDSLFDSFKGILAYVRVFQGSIKAGQSAEFAAQGKTFQVKEVGIFTPDFVACKELRAGDIGYIATGIKEAGIVNIGDTIRTQHAPALEGFTRPQPKVFASFYPLEEGEFDLLKTSLEKLQLSDPAITFDRTESPLLGRGFRIGFLGKLHMEIVAGRLEGELNTEIVVGSPSVAYKVDGELVTLPSQFPEHTKDKKILEPWVRIEVFTPQQYLGGVMNLLQDSDGVFKDTTFIDDENVKIVFEMALAQIVTQDFYDKLKSVSSGFASAEYESLDWRPSEKVRLDILVATEYIDAFSKIIERHRVADVGKNAVKKLKDILPQAQFVVSLQARVEGRIIAREDIPALKKAVTAPLYGGDWSRKKKLLVKQREGKKRMRQFGRVSIPKEVFLKMAG